MQIHSLLLEQIRRHAGWFILSIALAFLAALFNGVGVAMIAPALIGLLGIEMDVRGLPHIFQQFSTLLHASSPTHRALLVGGLVLLAIFLKNILTTVSSISTNYVVRIITNDLRRQIIGIFLNADMAFFLRSNVGTLVDIVLKQTDEAGIVFRHSIGAVSGIMTIAVLVAILLIISWKLTIACFIVLIAMVYISHSIIRVVRMAGKNYVQNAQRFARALHETFSGIRLVKATGSESRENDRLLHMAYERANVEFKAYSWHTVVGPLGETISVIALLMLVFLAHLLISQDLSSFSAVLLTFLFVLFRLLPQVNGFSQIRSEIARLFGSIDILTTTLNSDDKALLKNGQTHYSGFHCEIVFESVSFAHAGERGNILNHVSFSMPKGAVVALVGQSGAGKSTCADLLARFYDPTEGRITIDGTDLKEYDITSLRRSIGLISQETFLFDDSIRFNISYAKPEASDAEIIKAAKLAHAWDFIEQMPQGLDTLIGERGVQLSGGERQRLAIARALLQSPDILIMDEATSSLDTVSERLIQTALDELLKGRTTLVIAHRLSTIQNADKIIVLDRGTIMEAGSHTELLAHQGYYERLYQTQFQGVTPQIL